ncbi:MAG: hypothetical protein JO112_08800, partial [Planctomycetes bacterium]|nr:hypothetical protein [Planctomycetota bacterium]
VMLTNHQRANNFVLAAQEVRATNGAFEARLEVPAKLPWRRLVVRAYAVQDGEEGLGVLSLPAALPVSAVSGPDQKP